MQYAFLVAVTHAFIASPPPRRPLHLRSTNDETTTTLELVATNSGRLDAVLAEAYPERSRSEWGDFVKLGYVRVNDTPCTKKAATVKDRDAIVVELPASTLQRDERTCIAEDLPLDLLLEDDHLLVVNKEAGMVTHPAPGHRTGTLANAVAGYCANDAEGMESGRPGIVHRLDRFTSGCVVVARDSEARRSLQPVWKSISVSGAPENSSLSHFLTMARPCWLRRAVRFRHRHPIEQASRRWRRVHATISTQVTTAVPGQDGGKALPRRRRAAAAGDRCR